MFAIQCSFHSSVYTQIHIILYSDWRPLIPRCFWHCSVCMYAHMAMALSAWNALHTVDTHNGCNKTIARKQWKLSLQCMQKPMTSRTREKKCKAKKQRKVNWKQNQQQQEQHQHEKKPGDDIRWTKPFFDLAPSHRYHFLFQLKSDFKPFSFYCVRFLHVETLPHHPLSSPQLHTRLFFLCSSKKSPVLSSLPCVRFLSHRVKHTHTQHTQRAHNFVPLSNFLLKMAPRGTISWWRFLDVIENICVSLLWIFNEFCSSFPLFVRMKNIYVTWAFAVYECWHAYKWNCQQFSIIVMFFGKNRFQFLKIVRNVCMLCILCVSYFNK